MKSKKEDWEGQIEHVKYLSEKDPRHFKNSGYFVTEQLKLLIEGYDVGVNEERERLKEELLKIINNDRPIAGMGFQDLGSNKSKCYIYLYALRKLIDEVFKE